MESLFREYEGLFKEKEKKDETETPFVYAYSPFALQDAIGAKDIKKTWIEYQKLKMQEVSSEELIYKIINKVREMLAIKKGADKESLNIKKDFSFNKSKIHSKNWKDPDLESFYTKLIIAFHKSRQGENLEVSLEKLILNI